MALLKYENKRGSGKKLKVHFDLPDDEDYPISIQRHIPTSVSSESSSVDSDDTEEKDGENNSLDNFEPKFDDGNVYGSPVWSVQSGSVTQSPPTLQQMMSSNGYDPNRIPSSVFARSVPSPHEWSLASNESLFSLHLGNASFSRDHAFAFGNLSGELPRTSDFGSMPMPPLPPPPVQELNGHHKTVDVERYSVPSDTSPEDGRKIAETSGQVETNVFNRTLEDPSAEAIVPSEEAKIYASSVSYRSVESDRSFQFPILTADGVRSNSAAGGRSSCATVESVKQDKTENQQPDTSLTPPTSEAVKASKQGGGIRCWCCCFSCWPCY